MKTSLMTGRRGGRTVVVTVMGAILGLAAAPASAGSVAFPDFSNVGGLRLNGSAQAEGGVLRLTQNSGDQAGSAFSEAKVVNPSKSIRTKFRFRIHDSGDPADGLAFVIHRDPRGAEALGSNGHHLGYGEREDEQVRIRRSVAVEFNLHYGRSQGRVRVRTNGRTDRAPLASAGMNMYDRDWRVWIAYSPNTERLKVFVAQSDTKPDRPRLVTKVDLAEVLGGTGHAGFTAATGGAAAVHDIQSWRMRNP
ncbi:MAG TPA: L-type lectin-domain containing protein [Actinomycetota bacterium]|nr:L-type lectin-domain containing protein [Actinomycetota bacterium]